MQVEENAAKIEDDTDDYRIIITVEKRRSEAITREEAEMVLTRQMPLLFTQRVRSGGSMLSRI